MSKFPSIKHKNLGTASQLQSSNSTININHIRGQLKLVNKQGVPIMNLRDSHQESDNHLHFTSREFREAKLIYPLVKKDKNQNQIRNTAQNFFKTTKVQNEGFLSQRLSPLKLLEPQKATREASRDVSFLRESRSNMKKHVIQIDSFNPGDQTTLKDSSRKIIITERDFSCIEKGGGTYPRDQADIHKVLQFKRAQSQASLSMTSTQLFEKNSFEERREAGGDLSPDNTIIKNSYMLYPSFINSYQGYKLTKKNMIMGKQGQSEKFEKLKINLESYLDTQSPHNLPLNFPETTGMKQAFGQPTSRRQVELLINWFDDQMKNLMHLSLQPKNNEQEQPDLLIFNNDFQSELKSQETRRANQSRNIEELLDFTFQELVQQVSTQCQERGYLLDRVVQMMISIQQDAVQQLIKEKNLIFKKALSQITCIKDIHTLEICELETKNRDLQETLNSMQMTNDNLNNQIQELNKEIVQIKIKKSQIQKMNNHLIDSLIIKQNQLKLADQQFKFKIFNQVDDSDKQSTVFNLQPTDQQILIQHQEKEKFKQEYAQMTDEEKQQRQREINIQVEGLKSKLFNSRRGSKFQGSSHNFQSNDIQEQLKATIQARVKRLLENPDAFNDLDDDEDDIDAKSYYSGFNPLGGITSSLKYLQRNLKSSNERIDNKSELERNLSSLKKAKIKIQNLHDQQELESFERNMKNEIQKKMTEGNDNLKIDLKRANQDQLFIENLERKKIHDLMTPQNIRMQSNLLGFTPNKQAPVSTFKKQPTTDSYIFQGVQSEQISQHIDQQLAQQQDEKTESKEDSSLDFSNKSMQFPEDDILNYSDFLSHKEQKVQLPPVIVIKEQLELEPTPKNEQKQIQKGKFTKRLSQNEEEIKEAPPLIIDLNLKQFDPNSKLSQINEEPFEANPDHVQVHDFDQSDSSFHQSAPRRSSILQTASANIQTQNNNENSQKESHDPKDAKSQSHHHHKEEVDSKKAVSKEDIKKFLDDNDDMNIEALNQETIGFIDEVNEESNMNYEKLDEKNIIFYQNQRSSVDRVQQKESETKAKGQFFGKVDTIVSMILENLNTKQVSKKQLLQLVVSNILKNEQEEMKNLIIQQLFGNEELSPQRQNQSNNKLSTTSPLGNFQLPSYLMSSSRDEGIQTDPLLTIDFLDCGINHAEIYRFERKSQRLSKYVFHREEEQDIVKVQEFVQKMEPSSQKDDDKLKGANPIKQQLEVIIIIHLFQDAVMSDKLKIHRQNLIIKELLWKTRELQEQIATLEEKKEELIHEIDVTYKAKDRFVQQFDLYVNSWHKGFISGFERGMSMGYFKGAIENKDYGIQEGFQVGIKEGWQFGFDDGFKNGIRKIYQEAKEKGMDVNLLTPSVHMYLSQQEKREGIQLYIQKKLFKIDTFKSIGPIVRRQIQKFNTYTSQKKKHYAKLGLKTVIKMIRQFYSLKIGNRDLLLSEFIYEEQQKKFGHNKMAQKAFMQFIASCHYHMHLHPKIHLCASFLNINEKPYSIDVCNFCVSVIDGLQTLKIGVKNEYDEKSDRESIAVAKAVEVMREQLEQMLPTEVILELRLRIEKLKIKGKTKQDVIDLDKYMDFMVKSYIKFHIDLFNKPQLIYFALTLYERNHLGINELNVTLEVLTGDTLKMTNEQKEQIMLMKKSLMKLFEEGCSEGNEIIVRYAHFYEVLKDSDIFKTKQTREIFSLLPFRGHVQKFQEMFELKASELKLHVIEIYQNNEVCERMEYLDGKEYWIERLYSIERNIGEVNSSLLYLSLLILEHQLKFLKEYKDKIVRVIWEEKNHGKKLPENQSSKDLINDLMKFEQVGTYQESSIKQSIQSKVDEVAKNASPTFLKKVARNHQTIQQKTTSSNSLTPNRRFSQLTVQETKQENEQESTPNERKIKQ